ncbi:hypothetical protein BKA67DRAFT_574992 [Truncatella angustata]|uniref:Uncharacterized protein n=1 Tax=Truncatella angustata TaxID=152316 RepID=A0A9P8UEJ1_9PEZI|nr:uncharacterized protein BKA67DRAFT_574992 [Truncatella angustata]KAH6648497.1 hypothetical protein BKA67DRAFT_574992 [Truncatella angustata]
MEPQRNPSIEGQALARIHRIGQSREVTTVRLIMNNSIEKVSKLAISTCHLTLWGGYTAADD